MSSYTIGLTCPYADVSANRSHEYEARAEAAAAHAEDGGAIEVDLMDDTTVEFVTRATINVTCPTCGRTFETVLD